MSAGPAGPLGPTPPLDGAHAKLRQAAHQLEGVFVNELLKAMRATVPQDGIISQDPGQETFTGMLDERIAELYAGKSQHGLGEALYRQLSRRLPHEGS